MGYTWDQAAYHFISTPLITDASLMSGSVVSGSVMSGSVVSESVMSGSVMSERSYIVRSEMQDSSISTSVPVLDLVDSIKPESVNYELVESGSDEEVRP